MRSASLQGLGGSMSGYTSGFAVMVMRWQIRQPSRVCIQKTPKRQSCSKSGSTIKHGRYDEREESNRSRSWIYIKSWILSISIALRTQVFLSQEVSRHCEAMGAVTLTVWSPFSAVEKRILRVTLPFCPANTRRSRFTVVGCFGPLLVRFIKRGPPVLPQLDRASSRRLRQRRLYCKHPAITGIQFLCTPQTRQQWLIAADKLQPPFLNKCFYYNNSFTIKGSKLHKSNFLYKKWID